MAGQQKIVSALYFKGTWRDTFEWSATERMPFHAPPQRT